MKRTTGRSADSTRYWSTAGLIPRPDRQAISACASRYAWSSAWMRSLFLIGNGAARKRAGGMAKIPSLPQSVGCVSRCKSPWHQIRDDRGAAPTSGLPALSAARAGFYQKVQNSGDEAQAPASDETLNLPLSREDDGTPNRFLPPARPVEFSRPGGGVLSRIKTQLLNHHADRRVLAAILAVAMSSSLQ